MTGRLARAFANGWIGLLAGLLAWYVAHEVSFFLAPVNCATSRWLVPAIHVAALALTALSANSSYRAWQSSSGDQYRAFAAIIGLGAAGIFALVILWQGVAGIVYSGCER